MVVRIYILLIICSPFYHAYNTWQNYVDNGSSLYPQLGPYFFDGQRRVDYVLAYDIEKPTSVRRKSSKNSFIQRLRRRLSSRAPLQPKEDPEIAAQERQTDYHEDDKRLRREEFEDNILQTGLELEKDEEVRKRDGWQQEKQRAEWYLLSVRLSILANSGELCMWWQ